MMLMLIADAADAAADAVDAASASEGPAFGKISK